MLAVGGASSPRARARRRRRYAVNNGLVSGFARKKLEMERNLASPSRPFEPSRDAVPPHASVNPPPIDTSPTVAAPFAQRPFAASANTVPLTALAVAITNTGPFPTHPTRSSTLSHRFHRLRDPTRRSDLRRRRSSPRPSGARSSRTPPRPTSSPSTPDARARAVTSAPSHARDSPYRFTASTTASTMSRPTSSNRNAAARLERPPSPRICTSRVVHENLQRRARRRRRVERRDVSREIRGEIRGDAAARARDEDFLRGRPRAGIHRLRLRLARAQCARREARGARRRCVRSRSGRVARGRTSSARRARAPMMGTVEKSPGAARGDDRRHDVARDDPRRTVDERDVHGHSARGGTSIRARNERTHGTRARGTIDGERAIFEQNHVWGRGVTFSHN